MASHIPKGNKKQCITHPAFCGDFFMQRKEKMMIKRLKKKGRQAIAFMLSLLTIISTVAASSTTAFAADGTLYFNSGETIPYGSYFTTRMTSDGNNTAYCLEPSKKTPEIGSYQYTLLSQNSSIRKALYYLNGGYGYEKVTKSQCFSGWPDTDSYVIGHLALAYIYDGYNDSGDAFLGAPSSFVTKTKEVINFINAQPAPPKSFQAFILPADSHQTIAGSWYRKPYGWIELNKSTANGGIFEGNGNYSLAGAQYGIFQGNTEVAVITTNKNGYAKSGDLEEGNYTVREIQPSAGYAIDTKGYDVMIESDVTKTLNVKEAPQNNPIDIVLEKIDSETKEAEGKVKFEKSYLLSGDEFFYQTDGTTPCILLGTITVQETKTPEGYLVNTDVFVQKITADGKQESVFCYNASAVPE